MRWVVALLVAVLASRPAHASTGVVVVGDEALRKPIADALEAWLQHHGHEVKSGSLDADGITTITNCLLIDDLGCATAVVDSRSQTHDIVFAQVDEKHDAIALDVYWLVKGHQPLAERRACEGCTPDLLTGTVDSIMAALAASETGINGRLSIDSKPRGLTVVLDERVVGVTPVSRDLATGPHRVVLVDGTVQVGARDVVIHPTESAEIMIAAREVVQPSRVPGSLALGLGITAIAVGGVMYALSPTDDGSRYMFRDYRPPAIGLAAGGAAFAVAGVLLLLHERHGSSVPLATIDSHGGSLGWAHAF